MKLTRKAIIMLEKVDLHIHSTYSDGTNTVEELFQIAIQKNLSAISITDHDTIASYQDAIICSAKYNLTYLPGIELSTDYSGKEIHILGYGIDPYNQSLLQHLSQFIESRTNRNYQMLALLNNYGFKIDYQSLEKMFSNAILTRAHIARYLFLTKQLPTVQKAFRYIQDDGPCYVSRERFPVEEAIKLIHNAGGIAVVAHPTLYHLNQKGYEHLFSTLKDYEIDGIESIYSTYSVAETNLMKEYSKKYNLLISGGSDYHGENKPYIQMGTGRGQLFIPSTILEPIKQRLKTKQEISE